MQVGVLALQGDFAKHAQVLKILDCKVVEVRTPKDLEVCQGLIIPGGESTTMLKQIEFIGLKQPIIEFGKNNPLFGTCAGLILMSKQVVSSKMEGLQLLDLVVERNAYGRQVASFEAIVSLDLKEKEYFPAVFIRAPCIRSLDSTVQILGSFEKEPILVRQGHHLAATFHPELIPDFPVVHHYFLEMIKAVNYTK